MSWYRPRLPPVPVSEIHSTLRSIAARWPEDAMTSAPFKATIESIADDRFGPNRPSQPSDAETASGKELAGALDRLLANQYAEEYKLTEETMDPLGSPGHYLKVKRMNDKLDAYTREQGPWRGFMRFFRRKS